jgi:hypothetical protein
LYVKLLESAVFFRLSRLYCAKTAIR